MRRLNSVLLVTLLYGSTANAAQSILVDKSDATLTVFDGGQSVIIIKNLSFGGDPVGPKHFAGDGRTPEGTYVIDARNAASKFHLSLHISYPNAVDRQFASRNGRSPGGDVFIHGQPQASPLRRIPWNWTKGCIAVSNGEIERLSGMVRLGTQITIQP